MGSGQAQPAVAFNIAYTGADTCIDVLYHHLYKKKK